MKTLLALILVMVAVAVVPAAATARPVPTLVFNPSPVDQYQIFTVSGCGYPKLAALRIEYAWTNDDYYYTYPNVTTDESGCFSFILQAENSGSTMDMDVYHGSKLLVSGTEPAS
jgi:hypothetical protein